MAATITELNDIARQGFNARLGLTFTDLDVATGQVRATWQTAPHLLDEQGHLHPGAISAVMETVASIAGYAFTDPDERVVGVSNSTDYISSDGQPPLSITATLVDANPQQHLWELRITDSNDVWASRGTVRLQRLRL